MKKIDRATTAATVMGDFLPSFSFDAHSSVLLVENYTDVLQDALSEKNIAHTAWNRRFTKTAPQPLPWPESGDYSHIFIRLPKSHDAFDFLLHAVESVSRENTEIIVYGMNDEGIKGAQKKVRSFFGNCDVVGFKKGCRVLKSICAGDVSVQRSLTDFCKEVALSYDNQTHMVVSYPGLFNDGALDDGSRLLLDVALPLITGEEAVLDFACGTGVVAKVLHEKFPHTSINLLDNDILALTAAKENFSDSSAQFILDDSLDNISKKYDLIISNPPMHTEKDEHTSVIDHLIIDASQKLTGNGQLIIVTQTRLQLEEFFTKSFNSHRILAQNTKYTVWCGKK